jgi:hypothetical protein
VFLFAQIADKIHQKFVILRIKRAIRVYCSRSSKIYEFIRRRGLVKSGDASNQVLTSFPVCCFVCSHTEETELKFLSISSDKSSTWRWRKCRRVSSIKTLSFGDLNILTPRFAKDFLLLLVLLFALLCRPLSRIKAEGLTWCLMHSSFKSFPQKMERKKKSKITLTTKRMCQVMIQRKKKLFSSRN